MSGTLEDVLIVVGVTLVVDLAIILTIVVPQALADLAHDRLMNRSGEEAGDGSR